MPIDRTVQKVLDEYDALSTPALESGSPREAHRQPTIADAVRAYLQKHGEETAPEAVGLVENQMIPPGGEIPVRVYKPGGQGLHPVLVYFHGGSWLTGDMDASDASCRALCNLAQCLVISVAYRQAPEYPFPAAVDDASLALQWVLANADSFDGDPKRVAVGGESAGATLATVATLKARDEGRHLPLYQALIYPITNYAFDTASYEEFAESKPLSRERMHWFWQQYLPDESLAADPYASPLRAPSLAGLPPAVIITAENDPLRDEGEAYALRLYEAGVPVVWSRYKGMVHGFFVMTAVVEEARKAVAEVAAGLRSAFSREPTMPNQLQQLPGGAQVAARAQTYEKVQVSGGGVLSDEPATLERVQMLGGSPLAAIPHVRGDFPVRADIPVVPGDLPPQAASTPAKEAQAMANLPPTPNQGDQFTEDERTYDSIIPRDTPLETAEPIIPTDEEAQATAPLGREQANPAIPTDAQAQGLEPMTGGTEATDIGQPIIPPNPQTPGNMPLAQGTQAPGIGQMAGTPQMAGSAQMASNQEVRVGMQVVGADGGHLGQVKAISERTVLVDRPMHRDLTIPLEALSLAGDQVMVNLPADQAESIGWDQSSIM